MKNCFNLIFLFFRNTIHVQLIVSAGTSRVDHLLQPAWHGVHQVTQVVQVTHPGDPQPDNLPLQLLNVGAVAGGQLHLHP